MQDKIIKFVEDLKNRRMSLDSLDEASTRQVIINKLLHLLGWDIFSVDDVIPEYPVDGKNIDYALKIGRYNDKAFIEVKRIREDLERHQEQLLGYCFKEGVSFAVLTNGIIWWFYLPLLKSSWEKRRFYAIDITQQDSKDITSRFIQFLSKDNLMNGNALTDAEKISKIGQESVMLDEASRAWDKMIIDSNDKLIDLIGDATENLCGTRPDTNIIKKFLSGHEYHLKTIGIELQPPKDLIPLDVQQLKEPNLSDSPRVEDQHTVRAKNPISSFYFAGSKYNVDTWKGLLMKILEIIYSKHGKDFNKILDIPGRKRKFFSYNPQDLDMAQKFGDTNMYVEVKLSSKDIVKLCYDVIKLFGYSNDDLKIEEK